MNLPRIMRYSFLSVIIFVISTISGDVEISIMKAAPRLNNSMYYDYYFACHAEGEILQWKVNNTDIISYFKQSVGHVSYEMMSNCLYTSTLLSLKSLSQEESIFDSALIISCQESITFSVLCSNGSISRIRSNPKEREDTRTNTSIISVNMEHVLSQNLINEDNSSCINIFVCIVSHAFMTWRVQGKRLLPFSYNDAIGRERHTLQGMTTVEQQAILIGKEPDRLMAVLFVIDSTPLSVLCGYDRNTASLSSMTCPLQNMNTIESTTSTEYIPTTPDDEVIDLSGIIIPTVAGVFVILICASFCCCISCICCKLWNSNKNVIDGPPSYEREIPLRRKDFKGIKRAKITEKQINDFEQVQYILLTINDNTFNAGTSYIMEIENGSNKLTAIDKNVYLCMIGSHPVCLVNETEHNVVKKLEEIITQYFSNAKYLVFVGTCFVMDHKIAKLADVLISKRIVYITENEKLCYKRSGDFIAPEIRSIFCLSPEEVKGLEVAKHHKANHLVAKIAIGENISNLKYLRDFALMNDDVYVSEGTIRELMRLYTNGIEMGNSNIKKMQVIAIHAVIGYIIDKNYEFNEWQYIASQAAFHYITSKMKHQENTSCDISYEIKKPKPKEEYINYDAFCENVQFIIITESQDEFEAATTNISRPEITDDNDSIIQLNDGIVYIGKIGHHPVGLLHLKNTRQCFDDMRNAVITYFPNAKYLVNVGACIATDSEYVDLADVLISKEIYYSHYTGVEYEEDLISMTPEIRDIFCNADKVVGLQLLNNRRARHLVVRMGSCDDIWHDNHTKQRAMNYDNNRGLVVIGRDLLCLQNEMKSHGWEIHVIIVNGVMHYKENRKYSEWHFVASQAAFHYVCCKINNAYMS